MKISFRFAFLFEFDCHHDSVMGLCVSDFDEDE